MAIANSIFQLSGSIKGVTFYSVAGSDKVIMRKKGGPNKSRMANGKEFANVRKNQTEWAGCVLFAKGVRGAVGNLYSMSDYGLSSVWTGIGKNLIKLEKDVELGKRSVRLSTYKPALKNFNFNRKNQFSSILHVIPTFDIDRENLKASVTFPPINTENDLVNTQRLPYFRLGVCLGTVSDILFRPTNLTNYAAANDELQGLSISANSEWFSCINVLPEHTIDVAFEEKFSTLLTDEITLLLTIGVEFGNVGFGGEIVPVKRAGYAKIIDVI